MKKIHCLSFVLFMISSCGHMIGPMLYKKNDCGPYGLSKTETDSFKKRSSNIYEYKNSKPPVTCKQIQEFHCWDYQNYKLKNYDLKDVANKKHGNAIYIYESWEQFDDFDKKISYKHYKGRIFDCDQ